MRIKKIYILMAMVGVGIMASFAIKISHHSDINKSSLYKHTNALAKEQSAYLLQHAHNPVNWYPWSNKAFDVAKKEHKLIFVSIGYSTCHWCHVMEEESFENEEIASLLNKDYISIKVDKEELPHIDAMYQNSFSILNKNRNGWPLNFIMTPNKEIVHMGTYIPVDDDYGVTGLRNLLPKIAKKYYAQDKELLESIANISQQLENGKSSSIQQNDFSKIIELFLRNATKKYDKTYKGFERSPKFPLASHLGLLWDIYLQTNNTKARDMVIDSLLEMSKGGINDQIEGGFFRYSVYPDWAIPHFEKMLYTQAELIPIYTKVYLHTKDKRLKETIISTLEFANKTLRNQNGLYYSAMDADSKDSKGKKSEGFYYTYRYDEANNILAKNGVQNSQEILEYLNIDKIGNFEENLNNPYKSDFAQPKNYDKAMMALRELRNTKELPFMDKKMLTSWNSMMIKALVYGSYVDRKYLNDAKRSMQSLENKLIKNRKLYHQTYTGKQPSIDGLLEDYSFYIDALLALHQSTLEEGYLVKATMFTHEAQLRFYADKTWYMDSAKEYEATFGDRYYTAPVSRLLHSIISVAILNSDTKAMNTAKRYIDEQSSSIVNDSWLNAEGIRAIYRIQTGDVIIKSSLEKIKGNLVEIESIKKPFVFRNIQSGDLYLACDESSCFAYDKNIQNVIKAISSKTSNTKENTNWK